MHMVLRNILRTHRQERPGPHVQGHSDSPHTTLLQRVQQLRREVQSGCRRGHSPFVPGEEGLIVSVILGQWSTWPFDIRWQGKNAGTPHCVVVAIECERHAAIRFPPQHGGAQFVAAVEGEFITDVQPPRIASKRVPGAIRPWLIERDADPCGSAPRDELRRDHPRVVDYQHITRTQQRRQVTHHAIRQPFTHHMQQARRIARADGMLCDEACRQVEVEIGEPHQAGVGATRRNRRNSGMATSTAHSLPTT